MDLKMGISGLTLDAEGKGPEKVAYRLEKDKLTTMPTLGFGVSGYCFKDERGNIVDKEFKPRYT